MAGLGVLTAALVAAFVALAAVGLSASPGSLSFTQDVDDGATAAQATRITNDTGDVVLVSDVRIEGTNADRFDVDARPGDCDTSTVLADGESCDVHVTFTPGATGTFEASLVVEGLDTQGREPSATVPLDGTGTQTAVSATPTSLSFGTQDVDDGPTSSQTVVVANTGTENVDIDHLGFSGPGAADFAFEPFAGGDCSLSTLPPGTSCNVRVVFDPAVTGTSSATLDVVTTAEHAVDDIAVALGGSGTQTSVSASPTSLDFAAKDVDEGATAVQTVVLENTGTETVTRTGADIGGPNSPDFQLLTGQGTDCAAKATLGPDETCKARIRFDPDTTGSRSATYTYTSNAPDETVTLSGTGTQTLLEGESAELDLGSRDIDDGASAPQDVRVTNMGTETVDVDAVAISGTNASDFATVDDLASDCTEDTSLDPGEQCSVRVTFDPSATGARTGSVTVESNAPDVAIDLSGEGTQTELTADSATLAFDPQDVDDGPSEPQLTTITNTGTEEVVLTGVDADAPFELAPGASPCRAGDTLEPGWDCDLRIAYDPDDTGADSGTATITSNADDLTVSLSGTGIQTELTADPTSLAFGDQDVDAGATTAQESVIENTGTEAVSITSVTPTGDTGAFTRLTGDAGDCGDTTTLDARETCKVRVAFDPGTHGAKSVTYTVTSNADDVTVQASGTGTTFELTAAPGTLPFGARDIDAGATATQTSVVTNTGGKTTTLSAVTLGGANPKQFKRLTGAAGDCEAGTTLTSGQTCNVRAAFDPSFKGAKSATVTVGSDAPDATIALTGTGTESVFESSDDALDEGYVTNGQVNAVAFDSSGRTYLGGTFTSVGPRTGHGVRLSQSSDDPASGFPDVDGSIRAVVPDGSGGWFIGGDFTTVGGTPRSRLAHIASSGALDTTWDPAADGRVNALALSGGSLFVGGEFAAIDGIERTFLAKLSASSGDVDATWHPIVDNRVLALAVNGSGLHLGGDFTQVAGVARDRLARVATTGAGATDTGFAPDANGSVGAIALSADGDVFAGGSFTAVGGEDRLRIAKLDPATGAAVANWDPAANNTVSTLAVSGDDVYAGGSFTSTGSGSHSRLEKIGATGGVVDGTFAPQPNGQVLALAVSGSDVYVAGDFTQIGGQARNRLARVSTTDGAADGWDPSANGAARALAVAGTAVYAGGDFTSVGATARNRLARLEPDGTLDADWNPDANGTVSSLAISGTDVYAGGSFTSVGGQGRNRIAKLSTGGSSADPTWNPGATGAVNALAVSGTTVYAGGLFLTIDGQARNRLARLTGASGALDTGWLPDGASGQVLALALDGSSLYAGGAFTSIGGQPRNRIAKLASGGTGAVDTGWNPGANGNVNALAVRTSDVYAGGFFSTIGGVSRNFVAKLDSATGDVDPDWNPDANNAVRALALAGTDVYAGGDFSQVSGEPHDRLVKLPQAGQGTADAGWDPGIAGGGVVALAASGDRLAAGGSFTSAAGQSAQGFALLELPTLTVAPGGLAFGEHEVSDPPTAILTSTITNPRATPVTLSSVTLGGADAGEFSHLTSNSDDCKAGTVLQQNDTCTVRARFDPTSRGDKSAAVAIASNSPGVEVALTGTGVATGLSPSPTTLSFGAIDIEDGATDGQTTTITNVGTEQVDFAGITLGGANPADFEIRDGAAGDCATTTILQPGQKCAVRVRFDPLATGPRTATLAIDSNAPDATVGLSGSGTQTELSRSPATLPFGKQDIDDAVTAAQESTVTNSGTETVTISGVEGSGDTSELVRLTDAGSDCAGGTVLTAGQTCKLRVAFDPATTGAKTATFTVKSDAADVAATATGTGTQTQLTQDPSTLSFGKQDVDDAATASQLSTVTNTGTETVTLGAASLTGADAGDFRLVGGSGTACDANVVLTAGQSCNVRVAFDPTTTGAKAASVLVDSNADDVSITLSGAATQTELSRSPTALSFGAKDIDDGATATQDATVTNSGTEVVDLDAVTFGGAHPGDFAQVTGQASDCTEATSLAAGETCRLRLRFDPAAMGSRTASVTVESNAADVSVSLAGTGIQTLLTTTPATVAFGNHNITEGATTERESTVTNAGTESVTLTGIAFSGDTTQFERLTGAAGDCTDSTTLTAGQTCKLRARFDPTSTGAKAATLMVKSNAEDVVATLTGTGVLTQLQRSAATLAFGPKDIDDGATTPQTSTITNTGSETVSFTSISATGDTTQFERLTGESSDCSDTTVLTAGQACDVRVRFDPASTGAKAASITIASNASDQTISLSGAGIQTQLTPSPATLAFGSQDVGEGATGVKSSTVTNTGTEAVSLDGVTESGDAKGSFTRLTDDDDDCDGATELEAGETCTVRVEFDPATEGFDETATYTVESDAPDVTVDATGHGILKHLSVGDATFAFGARDIDDGAATKSTTITNTGDQTITIESVGVTGDTGDFTRPSDQAEDCSAGDVLEPEDTCAVRVEFDPPAVGAKSATVTIDSNAPDVTVALTGTGIQTELSRSPTSLPFGSKDIDENATAAQESTITNSGTETVDLDAVTLGGTDPSQFQRLTGEGTDCTTDTSLDAGETCKLRVTFDPSSTGAKAATLTVESNADDVAVTLSGTGIQTELSRSPASLTFGAKDIDDGATATQTSTVTNTGSETVDLDGVALTGDTTQFERLSDDEDDCTASTTLTAGQTCDVRFRFHPTTVGSKSAVATVDSDAADITVALSGTGTQTQLTASPAALSFGDRDIDDGATATQTSTVTNTGTEPVTISSFGVSGDDGDFARLLGTGDCAAQVVLTANQSCTVRMSFDPATTGAKSATLTLVSNAPDETVGLTGTGIQTQLSRTPEALAFGAQDVDDAATAAQTSTVTNSGTQPVTLTAVGVSGDDAHFPRLTGEASDCKSGDTLTAGQTCKLRFDFDPSTTGAKSATVTVTSNAAEVAVGLTGTGTQTQLTASPATLAFGDRDVDDAGTAPQSSTVTNTGTEPVTVGTVGFTGDADDFKRPVTGGCATGAVLTAGQTCKVPLRFDPATTGAKTVTVTVQSNAADVTVTATGTGIQTELTRSTASLAFGSRDIDDGPTATQDATVTNSGTEPVTLAGVATTGAFERVTGQGTDCAAGNVLAAGATCKLRMRFDPATTGAKTGSVTVDSNAADVVVDLSGTGTQTLLGVSPASLSFGSREVDAGPTAIQEATVTNTGSEPVDFDGVTLGGAAPGQFERLSDQAGDCSATTTLGAGETCKLRVRFDPSARGGQAATATVTSNAAPVTVALSGTGVDTELTAAPAALAFGARDTESSPSAAQTSTITNSGTEPIELDALTLTGDSGHFERLTGQGSDCTATTTLAAGDHCEVRARFDPTTVGAKTATVTVASNVPDVTVALSGTGTRTTITRTPVALAFGGQDVDDGATAAKASTIANPGTEPVTIDAITVSGRDAARFEVLGGQATDCAAGDALAAGETCTVRARFDPAATVAHVARIDVEAQAPAADVSIDLSGTGTQTTLSLSRADLALGSVDVDDGPGAAEGSTLTNTGSEPVRLDAVSLGGPDASQFQRVGGDGVDCEAGRTLAAGETCAVRARFDPAATGGKTATITVESAAGAVGVALSGTGIQTELSLTPVTLAFGARTLGEGASAPQAATVRNSGTQPVTLSAVTLGGPAAGEFAAQAGQPTDCAAGRLLGAGETCAVRVTFDPSSAGDKAATLRVTSNAADVSAALTGTGAATRLVLGSGPKRASQTKRKTFRVKLSSIGGVVPKATLTLTRASGKRIKRVVVKDVGATRTVTFRLKRALKAGRYTVTATAPAATQVGAAKRTYRLR